MLCLEYSILSSSVICVRVCVGWARLHVCLFACLAGGLVCSSLLVGWPFLVVWLAVRFFLLVGLVICSSLLLGWSFVCLALPLVHHVGGLHFSVGWLVPSCLFGGGSVLLVCLWVVRSSLFACWLAHARLFDGWLARSWLFGRSSAPLCGFVGTVASASHIICISWGGMLMNMFSNSDSELVSQLFKFRWHVVKNMYESIYTRLEELIRQASGLRRVRSGTSFLQPLDSLDFGSFFKSSLHPLSPSCFLDLSGTSYRGRQGFSTRPTARPFFHRFGSILGPAWTKYQPR